MKYYDWEVDINYTVVLKVAVEDMDVWTQLTDGEYLHIQKAVREAGKAALKDIAFTRTAEHGGKVHSIEVKNLECIRIGADGVVTSASFKTPEDKIMPEAKDSEPKIEYQIRVNKITTPGCGWATCDHETIYEQTVEKLDLQSVIKAVNYTQVTLFTVNEVEAVKNVETVNPGAKTDD